MSNRIAIKLIHNPASKANPIFNWFKANNKLNPKPLAPMKAEITAIEKHTMITWFTPIKISLLAVGAGYLIGGIRSALVVCGLTLFIALSPWWDRALVTTYMATFGVIMSCAIGFTVGTLCFQSKRAAAFMLGICDIFQTFPSFVYLTPTIHPFS